MKKVLSIAFVAIMAACLSAKAQIQEGNVMVGGNFANLSLGLDNSKVFSFDVTPKAAWFIQDNIALGGYVNLGIQTAKNSSTTTNYGVGALGKEGGDHTIAMMKVQLKQVMEQVCCNSPADLPHTLIRD